MKPNSTKKPNELKPKLILGLGNPGREYASTYHNAGHLFIDFIKNILSLEEKGGSRLKEKIECFENNGRLFCKSLTFMNLSGNALKDGLKLSKAKPEEILIAHDDSDLPIGSYKLSFDKNSAGHKGVDSIIKTLGAKNFWRLRIGIRPANEKTRSKAETFVLKKISATDKKSLYSTFGGVIEKLMEKENP